MNEKRKKRIKNLRQKMRSEKTKVMQYTIESGKRRTCVLYIFWNVLNIELLHVCSATNN